MLIWIPSLHENLILTSFRSRIISALDVRLLSCAFPISIIAVKGAYTDALFLMYDSWRSLCTAVVSCERIATHYVLPYSVNRLFLASKAVTVCQSFLWFGNEGEIGSSECSPAHTYRFILMDFIILLWTRLDRPSLPWREFQVLAHHTPSKRANITHSL